MDNYLASGSIKDAENFVLNLNFELLKGCTFNCRGCFVNKDQEKIIGEDETEKLFELLDTSSQSGYNPFIAFVGPTDFLVAENTVQVLSDPQIIEILNEFKRLSFVTTYLNVDKMDGVVEVLHKYYKNCEIEVNMVVDHSRIMDDRYLNLLEKNKKIFLHKLNRADVRSFGIMNVYDYDKTKIANLLKDYEFMHKRVQHLFETTIDYNFSLGRKPDLTTEEFSGAANRIKQLFNDSVVSTEKAQYLRFSFGKLTDSLIEKQYNYLNGKLYSSPLLYERFASFKEEFEIPTKTFHIKEIEEYENLLISKQYANASKTTECEECIFLGSCVDRGILFLMETYGVKDCLVAKDALETINNYGHKA
jgi:hypothetical protein